MSDALIENPILNRPFGEPSRHFKFDEGGITTEVVESRRVSSYFMPIPGAKRTSQQHFEIEWTEDRIEENRFINEVRDKVGQWRKAGHPNVTPVTARLLKHWTDESRERRLFFCQIEAVETAIYIAEVASKFGDTWIEKRLAEFAEDANPGLFRIALKMATGSGKTVVMSMLIAWQVLNKLASQQDKRFTDAFLVVTPGITIKDRLRVLMPSDPDNYYRVLDLVPPADRERLGQAKIALTNFRFSSRFGGELSAWEVDLDGGAAEVDHRDERVG